MRGLRWEAGRAPSGPQSQSAWVRKSIRKAGTRLRTDSGRKELDSQVLPTGHRRASLGEGEKHHTR